MTLIVPMAIYSSEKEIFGAILHEHIKKVNNFDIVSKAYPFNCICKIGSFVTRILLKVFVTERVIIFR